MILGKNDKLLFIGDSISDYDRARPVGEGLFKAWGTSYVADVGSLLCCMYPELNLRIVNMGISGNQIRDLDRRWQTDVLDLKPDFVSRRIDAWLMGRQAASIRCRWRCPKAKGNRAESAAVIWPWRTKGLPIQ